MASSLETLAQPFPQVPPGLGARRSSGGDIGAPPAEELAAGIHPGIPPARASGVELLGQVSGSGYRRPPSLVRRADGQTIQLTPILYRVLEAIDGRRGHEEIAAQVGARISKVVADDDVRFLIDEKLRPLGLLRQPDGSEPAPKHSDPLLALRLRQVITNPAVTGRITAPFAALFHPAIVPVMLVAFAATCAWVLFIEGLAGPAREALYDPGRLLIVFALAVLSAGFHEFGHAAAARYGGVKPGAMGVGLYLVWPVFYTDVTEAYRLGRIDRLRVDVGGLYFNAVFAVVSVGVWSVTGWDSLLLLVPIQIGHMLHQLLPLVRFDGYHILADLTGVPDLFAHIKPTLRSLVPRRRRERKPSVLRPGARAIVTLWVLTVVPALALVLVAIVVAFPRLAATAWDSVRSRWELLEPTWRTEGTVDAAVVLLSIVFVLLPVAGAAYLVGRVVRRTSTRVWRGTRGRPILRSLAVLGAAAAIAALGWAWWPDGQYRPIEAREEGTAFDLAAAMPIQAMPRVEEHPVPVPPGAAPRLAFVLTTPDDPDAAPIVAIIPEGVDPSDAEWVFPFDPPVAPDENDNQALAVNTADGSTVYDVSISVVWVTEGPVDTTNEAWALASCLNCETAAVAYQAVFVVDGTAAVVPENIAVAVNYRCGACDTTALAGQLVVTLTGLPGEEAMAELAALQEELEALEDALPELSIAELYEEIERIEAEIVSVLIEDGALEFSEAITVEASTVVSPTPSPEAPVTDTGTAATDPSPTESPSPEPTESPTPEPSESPSPEPTESPSPEPEPSQSEAPSPSP